MEFAVIGALGPVELEMLRRHLDEAFQCMNAGACSERAGQVVLRKSLADQFGVADALHEAHPHEDSARRFEAERIDDLGAKASEHQRLHQHHALIVQPDATIPECKMQHLGQVPQRRTGAIFKRAAGASVRPLPLLLSGFRE